jgi:hypothetical protein
MEKLNDSEISIREERTILTDDLEKARSIAFKKVEYFQIIRKKYFTELRNKIIIVEMFDERERLYIQVIWNFYYITRV